MSDLIGVVIALAVMLLLSWCIERQSDKVARRWAEETRRHLRGKK